MFHQRHPDVALELLEHTSDQQLKEIRAERVDVGFLMPPLPDTAGLQVETVFRENLVAVLPHRHPLVGKTQTELADLANEPFVMFPVLQGPGLYAHIMIACARAGFTPRVVQEAHHWRTLIGLVAAEIGVTLVPASLRDSRQADVVYLEVYDTGVQPQYDLAVVWREANASPVLKSFLAVVRAGTLQT
jgi:DNA-binding transcriptional LysR family regulator